MRSIKSVKSGRSNRFGNLPSEVSLTLIFKNEKVLFAWTIGKVILDNGTIVGSISWNHKELIRAELILGSQVVRWVKIALNLFHC